MLIFKSTSVDPPAEIYMGKDKFENEELIKYPLGSKNDIWFHVDNLSSAHVYLSVPEPDLPDSKDKFYCPDWQSIPEPLLIDLAQLVKANSIEGNKKDNITVIFTPWINLKKTPGMPTGQVSHCLIEEPHKQS